MFSKYVPPEEHPGMTEIPCECPSQRVSHVRLVPADPGLRETWERARERAGVVFESREYTSP